MVYLPIALFDSCKFAPILHNQRAVIHSRLRITSTFNMFGGGGLGGGGVLRIVLVSVYLWVWKHASKYLLHIIILV